MDNKVFWLEPVSVQLTSPTQVLQVGIGTNTITTKDQDALFALKNEIETVGPISQWDDAKKITNPYEYIFLSLQKRMHKSISALSPLSRSYFKMIELWDMLQLQTCVPADGSPLLTSHSAEGPGGFLEAIQHRTKDNADMIAMTLKSTEKAVPGWRKSQAFLQKYPTVEITYGEDGTGNLYSLANQDTFQQETLRHFNGKKAHLYTADGGFDFSADFNSQENTVQRLLAAEALCGIRSLQTGGTMILKIFDTKHVSTLELMWVISMCFTKTGLIKPKTSRPANSERYWIGVGLRPDIPTWIISLLRKMTSTEASAGWSALFADHPVWTPTWVQQVIAFQEQIEEHQLHSIQQTLNLIKSPSRQIVRDLIITNVRNSRLWCKTHGITLNPVYAHLSDEQIVSQNLEEALAPFPVLAERIDSPTGSPPQPKHHVLTSSQPLPPPTGKAWRSALPASILGPKS